MARMSLGNICTNCKKISGSSNVLTLTKPDKSIVILCEKCWRLLGAEHLEKEGNINTTPKFELELFQRYGINMGGERDAAVNKCLSSVKRKLGDMLGQIPVEPIMGSNEDHVKLIGRMEAQAICLENIFKDFLGSLWKPQTTRG